ncbi:MAG: hypothetical protein ABI693_25290 [Bryobacteraceae bacterium]
MSKSEFRPGEALAGALDQVGALGRRVGRTLDQARLSTADALTDSASSVRDTGETIDAMAGKTAAGLDSTAKYIRRHEFGDLLGGLRQVVRHHPGRFLMGAAAAGFILGLAVRSGGSQKERS